MKKIFVAIAVFLTMATGTWAAVPGFMKARMGTLQGQLYVDGKIMPQVIVSFFDKKGGPPPVMGSARRVPDMVARTDDKAKFSVKLLPGAYYMGAMIRERGKGPGPPRKGEKYYFIRGEKGSLRAMTVKTKAVTDAGRVNGSMPGEFKEFKTFITISGKVVDEKGEPRAGVLVTLKEKLNAPRPKYIAKRTGKDGGFSVKVPPGKYFVMARESIKGGRPAIGSSVGTYGKTAPAGKSASMSIVGKTGPSPAGAQGGGGTAIAVGGKDGETISGIVIDMFKIPDPKETRKKYLQQARAHKLDAVNRSPEAINYH